MAVNRNFVVKNGLEVAQDLILANDATRRIGIGSTVPEFTLDVRGGIGASTVYVSGIASINVGVVTTLQGTNLNYSGVSTITSLRGSTAEYDTLYGDVGIITAFNTTGIGTIETKLNVGAGGTVFTAFVNAGVGSVGIGTSQPAYTVDIRGPVSTGVTALYVQGDVRVTGDINVDDITFDQADISYLNVTGFATVSNLFITGIGSITSQVGLITNITGTNLNYSGIGTVVNLRGTNLNYTGVGTIATLYGTNAEFDNLYTDIGIATVLRGTNLNYTGIGTVTNLRGTNLNYTGVGTIATLYGTGAEFDNIYVDVGIVTVARGTNLNYTGVGTIATLYGNNIEYDNLYTDIGIATVLRGTNLNYTGVGTITTLYGTGAEFDNIYVDVGIVTVARGTNLNYTGISTLTNARGANLNFTGVGTITTLYGTGAEFDNIYADVGIVTNISGTNLNYTGIGTITNLRGTNLNVSGISTLGNVVTVTQAGIITSANPGVTTVVYYGDGTNLTGVVRGVGIASTNPSTGLMSVVGFGATIITFKGPGISTTSPITVSAGIATITFEGGGGGTGGYQTTILKESYTVTAATQSVFNLANTYTSGYVDVYLNGVKLNSGDFTETDADTITLSTAANNGDIVEFVNYKVIAVTGDFQTTIVKEEFTVTAASQSAFTLSNAYTSGYIDVYLNGSKLTSSDYTETDPTTVTLTSAAVTGDVVEFINFEKRGISEVDPFWITTNSGATRIGIHTLTKVGIGTTLPTSNLHVNGNALITGITTHNANIVVGAGYSVGIGTNNPPYHLTVTEVGATPTPALSYCIADFTNNVDGYSQVNIRNASTNSTASGDLVITTDNGTDTTNYIDLGINNSGFSTSTWTINGALDGYLYSSNQNFSIGVAFTNRYLSFFAGGTLASNEKMRITNTGVGIGTTNTSNTLQVGTGVTFTTSGINVTGIITASSDIKIGSNSVATNGKAIAMAMVFGG